jgi:hypothetical protein
MLIVMQDMSKISVYDSPLMHFIAIISVDAYTKTLRLSFHYTKFLAAVRSIADVVEPRRYSRRASMYQADPEQVFVRRVIFTNVMHFELVGHKKGI